MEQGTEEKVGNMKGEGMKGRDRMEGRRRRRGGDQEAGKDDP